MTDEDQRIYRTWGKYFYGTQTFLFSSKLITILLVSWWRKYWIGYREIATIEVKSTHSDKFIILFPTKDHVHKLIH